MRVARRFVVRGRVQGVGFRVFAAEAARREGLSGWVRNRDDGTVEAHAEGEAAAVARFEQQLRHGPPAARVDSLFGDDDVPDSRWTGFMTR